MFVRDVRCGVARVGSEVVLGRGGDCCLLDVSSGAPASVAASFVIGRFLFRRLARPVTGDAAFGDSSAGVLLATAVPNASPNASSRLCTPNVLSA